MRCSTFRSTPLFSAISWAQDDGRIVLLSLGLVTAVALMTRGILRAETYLVAISSLGVLFLLPQLVFEIFEGAIGALVSMLVIGLILVLLSVRIAKGRHSTPKAPSAMTKEEVS